MSGHDIARIMDRDRAYIVRKQQALRIQPGISPAHIAALARINMRRRLAIAA
jgi:hypothetical protein